MKTETHSQIENEQTRIHRMAERPAIFEENLF